MPSQPIPLMPMHIQGDTESVIAQKPWKYHGYSKLTKWMSLDSDFFVLRRFSALNARLIIDREIKIAALERQLEDLDDPHKVIDFDNGTVLGDQNFQRVQLLERLWSMTKDYNQFVAAHAQLRSQPYASKLQTDNLNTWLGDHQGAINHTEAEFMTRKDDLISIENRPKHALRQWLEQRGSIVSSRWFRDHERTRDVEKMKDECTHLFDGKKLDRVSYILVVIVGLVMLIVPLWGLYLVNTQAKQLAIISGCVVAFTGLVGVVTVAQPFETLAASAAYAAVLMVFIQGSQANNR